MKAVGNRAGLCSRFYDTLLLRSEVAAFRKMEVNLYLDNPSWISTHYLFSLYLCSFKGEAVALGGYAHDSEHAAAKRAGQKVSRGEAFSFAVVVQRGIGEDFCSALEVGDLVAEVALING